VNETDLQTKFEALAPYMGELQRLSIDGDSYRLREAEAQKDAKQPRTRPVTR